MEDLVKLIEQLGPAADRAGELAQEQSSAIASEHEAGAQLLKVIIKRIKPGLRAVCSRVLVGRRSWWIDSVRTDSEETTADWRGICLSDDRPGPGRTERSQGLGVFDSCDLFLDTDGVWHELQYSGKWSVWQGVGDQWDAEDIIVDAATVARDWTTTDVIRRLSDALQRQLSGGREKATVAATKRAELARALVTLLEGGRR